jgi:DNA (cytosine-5)-methyltransferase 3A
MPIIKTLIIKNMNVLSLFDGMSCGQIALNKLGIKYDNYFASEIKKHAIKVTQDNYPRTKQLGSVEFVNGVNLPKIDLLIGGSPCQDLTIINNKKAGLNGDKSILFYEYLRVLKEVKPTYFLLENVASMNNKDKKTITDLLGVEPIMINSNLVSAADRRRYYWTNIPNVEQPKDKSVLLKDIIDYGSTPEENMSEKKKVFIEKKRGGTMYVRVDGDKSMPITARGYAAWNTQFITDDSGIRDLTLNEYKKLQTIPLDYKMDVIKSKATDLIGDGWTVDVIAHIFKNIPTNK